ncbi:MAG: hypothetical protein WC860_00015 [Candidatus Margulisiibacteriota bacterium]
MKNKLLTGCINKKVVSLSAPKLTIETKKISEPIVNSELRRKPNFNQLLTNDIKPIKKIDTPDITNESAMIGVKVGVPSAITAAITIGSASTTASTLAAASPVLFTFAFGATLGISGLLTMVGAFIGPFLGLAVGALVGLGIALVNKFRHKGQKNITGPIKYKPSPPKQLAIIGAFSGVIAGAIQGGIIGSVGGPFGTFLGIVLGGAICGIMGFVGGYAGGMLLNNILQKINKSNLDKYNKKMGLNKDAVKSVLPNPKEPLNQNKTVASNTLIPELEKKKEPLQTRISNLQKMIEKRNQPPA